VSWSSWIQSTPCHPIYLRFILILSFHILLVSQMYYNLDVFGWNFVGVFNFPMFYLEALLSYFVEVPNVCHCKQLHAYVFLVTVYSKGQFKFWTIGFLCLRTDSNANTIYPVQWTIHSQCLRNSTILTSRALCTAQAPHWCSVFQYQVQNRSNDSTSNQFG
jgi:hypothetical protein